ncbi:MAG: hypothetical protein U9P12_06085, partial [Verrucomicrobiota bacterium]|nr:hypothetical protein [Verrucomicrobiota bacterium]
WEGAPILPVFKTTELPLDLIEAIHSDLVVGEACVTNGPVFRDFDPRGRAVAHDPGKTETSATNAVPSPVDLSKFRIWTGEGGRTFESELITVIGDKVVLRDVRGKQRKIPFSKFSAEDRTFIELANPPVFNIDFSKQSSQRIIEVSPFNGSPPPKLLDYVFGAKLRQTSSRVYNHELHAEFFAIGAEIDGDNFILLDRQESTFTPTEENKRSHSFRGKTVTLTDYLHISAVRRGQKYGGYLVVVTDSRGVVIAHETSNKWLFQNLENLKKLPLGKHFDKTCTRVGPPRLERNYYGN